MDNGKPIFRNYVLSGYPLLWISTFEEYRAMKTFCAEMTCAKEEYPTFSWDRDQGIMKVGIKDNLYACSKLSDSEDPIDDPLAALEWLNKKAVDNSVLFLLDFHHYVKKDIVTRKIRNLVPSFKAVGKVIVIISPTVDIPLEIEKEITVINFKLPDRDNLRTVLKGLCESAKAEYPKDDTAILDASLGMTEFEAENAYSMSLIEKKAFDASVVCREKAAVVKKTGLLEVIETTETLDDIGGLENLKDWLLARKDCYSDKARKFGVTSPKGLLLVGIPGTGKSLACKASAAALQRPLLRLDIGKLFGGVVGESESNVRRAIAIAEAVAPAIVWVDELEKSLGGMKSSNDGDSGTSKRVLGSLLTWLSEKTADVFIVATANNVDCIPPEMLRSGRFDCLFWVDLPNAAQRKEILGIHLRKKGRDISKLTDVDKLVAASADFSGAEIEVWVKEALVRAFSRDAEDLTSVDLLETVKEVTPVARLMAEDITKSREWAKSRAKYASRGEESVVITAPKRKLGASMN